MRKIVKIFIWIIISLLIVAIAVFLLCFVARLAGSERAFSYYKQNLPNYNDSPVLVFKQVDFYKYLVSGKPDGTDKHLDSLDVYLVKGKADFGFDLSLVSIDDEATDYFSRALVIDYQYKTYFPVFVDVQISANDFVQIEKIRAQQITEDEASKAAKVVASLGGTAGALFGGIAGSKFAFSPVKKIIGGAVGGIAGGAGVATSSYLMTKNFLLGIDFESAGDVRRREELLDYAKPVIALELLDNSMTAFDEKSLSDWERAIISKYECEIKNALTEFFAPFGWKTVQVNFNKVKNEDLL